jgi:hypothetical protein
MPSEVTTMSPGPLDNGISVYKIVPNIFPQLLGDNNVFFFSFVVFLVMTQCVVIQVVINISEELDSSIFTVSQGRPQYKIAPPCEPQDGE